MADPRDPKETSGEFLTGAVCGGLLGLVVGASLVAVIGYPYLKRKLALEAFEDLVPVVVATRNIPADTVITFDLIGQRATPERFVTRSVVKPDSVNSIIGQRITAPALAGDMLLWSQFPTPSASGPQPSSQ